MSRHFTYEIDESNLSFKLKNLQLPISEEAWQKFNNLADGCFGEKMISNRFQYIAGLRIPLNRKTLMPLAFGISITMFAILLFNFVSIKVSPKKIVGSEQVKITETVLKQETKQKLVEKAQSTQPEVQQTLSVNKQTNPAQTIKQPIVAAIPAQTSIAKLSVGVQQPQTIDFETTSQQVMEQIRPDVVTEDDENSVAPLTP